MFCVCGITQLRIDVTSKCMVVLGMEQVLPKMLAEMRLMTDNDTFHAGSFKSIGVWKKSTDSLYIFLSTYKKHRY